MQGLKIVTFNIRCPWEGDGINTISHRLGSILTKLDEEQPDIVCFQECVEKTADFLTRHLPDYEILYSGRLENYNGEGLITALRRDTVQLMANDFFWLSPTPHIPASRFEIQSPCPRITQSVLVRRLDTMQPLWIYNNHLDHISDQARILGIQQALARVAGDQVRCAAPVFIMGDFNAVPNSETIRFCDNYDKLPLVNLTAGIGTTFHDYGRQPQYEQIDYIYTDTATAKQPHTVTKWQDEQDGIYLSDHYPVCLTLSC